MQSRTGSKTQDSRLSMAGLVLSRHCGSRTPASGFLYVFLCDKLVTSPTCLYLMAVEILAPADPECRTKKGETQKRWMEALLAHVAHPTQTHQPSRVVGQL